MTTLKVTSKNEVLKTATKAFITDLGGTIGHSWSMEQCGNAIWYTSHGYVNNICVKMRYDSGDSHLTINGKFVKIEFIN